MKISVLGSGAWGTALAVSLARGGHETLLWSRREEAAAAMSAAGENPRLPGVPLPSALLCTADLERVRGSDLTVFACPSSSVRSLATEAAPFLTGSLPVSVAKGIEKGTGLRMSQIIRNETGQSCAVLSGPSHAEEVGRGIPTGCVAAAEDRTQARLVQDVFMSPSLRIYTSPDIVGVELGGALKNIYALCAGISDGLGLGDNTKALLMTRSLTEMARLGIALGARRETLAGLAGVGDLIVTCTSMHSRNRRAGILLGRGKSVDDAMREVGAVVEGYYAADSAMSLRDTVDADMPILEQVHAILYHGADPRRTAETLMRRGGRDEMEDAGWNPPGKKRPESKKGT